ncbi:MAG: putative protein YacP [Chloroflexi bacterium]|nr:putative protein YacP [Chloroflexota bacterium]
MPYIIDGHNLIPKIAGIDLGNVDDEQELIQRLQDFSRQSGKRVEVFFDKAPPGQARSQRYGKVVAFFVREGRTADEAILKRLRALGGEGRNWTVVSSDGEVRRGARQSGARTATSQAFARQLSGLGTRLSSASFSGKMQSDVDDEEIEYWLEEFSNR